jgi:hypothetical protein
MKMLREEMTDIEVTPDHRQHRGDRDGDKRRGGRDRGGRGRERGGDRRPGPKHEHTASMTPVDASAPQVQALPQPVAAAAPAAEQRAERPHRERHPRKDAPPHRERQAHPPKEHAPREHAPKPAAHAKAEHHAKPEKRERGGGRGHHKEDRADNSQAGSNDHMPAFLMRPVPQHLIKRKKETEPV